MLTEQTKVKGSSHGVRCLAPGQNTLRTVGSHADKPKLIVS